MTYETENRLTVHQTVTTLTNYQYSGDGLKRTLQTNSGAVSSTIWDGSDYLGEV